MKIAQLLSAAFVLSLLLCGAAPAQDQAKAPIDVAAIEAKAKLGDTAAMTRLGKIYFGKQGIPADYDKAKFWLERAADAGAIEAQMMLGAAYMSGSGFAKNDVLASKYLLQVADASNILAEYRGTQALAQYFISRKYDLGSGIEQSHPKAVEYLRRAADGGNSPAQFDLGNLYFNGSGGVPVDKALACRWFEKAADQGHTRAMHNTAYCYQMGMAGEKNIDKAIHYYTLAAQENFADSQHNLGLLYTGMANGEKGYFWLRIAQMNGLTIEPAKLDAARACMTPAQLDQQNKEIAEWLNSRNVLRPVQ